jgi:L-asparagine transporter-like permease
MYLQSSDSAVCSGVIGTGLFLSSANSLRHGGPVGLLLGYLVVGSICYSVMVSREPSTFPVLVHAR